MGLSGIVVENNSIFIDDLKLNPLQGKLLALRIGVNNSTLSNKKKELSNFYSDFLDWIQSKDPNGIRWISLGGSYSKGYIPANDTPIDKLQALKEWLQVNT